MAALGALAVIGVTLFLATIRVNTIPENVAIAGIDVSGMDYQTARNALAPTIDDMMGKIVTFRSDQDPDLVIDLPAGEISSGPEFDQVYERARTSRGRFGRMLSRFGIAGHRDIPLTFDIRPSAMLTVSERAEANVGAQPTSAVVRVEGDRITIRAGREGRSVDRRLLAERVATLPDRVEVPLRIDQPLITTATAKRAVELAERMRGISREVTYKRRRALLEPAVITSALTFTNRETEIDVGLRPGVLRAALAKPLGIVERPPTDAKWRLRGDVATVIPAKNGILLDAEALGSAIRSDPTVATIAARVRTRPPRRTTAAARALRITERVSSFTTPYDCCQPRVVNIGRAAQILDSTLIMPGERFSMNDALGERTSERGFVEAPSIEGGELKPTVGGGVSQVATTLYNAAFFAGLEIVTHTPHSFYFPRYPAGREATISWRTPDLVFRNNWDAAILMSVATATNGITINLYSSKLGRRVETTSTPRANVVKPKTIERLNTDLEPGSEKLIQGMGQPGFSISYTRRVYRNDELVSDSTFYWTYKPENEIIEKGPPKPDEPRTGTGTSTTPTGTTGTTTSPTTSTGSGTSSTTPAAKP